jgi:cell division protein FtsW (lipid II flippase)
MAEKALKRIDWILVFFILPIISFGLVTMRSFVPEENAGSFFNKQIIWVLLSFTVFFIFSFIDFRFLKQTNILVALFLFFCLVLLVLFILGSVSHGAQSWFDFGGFSFQPADMMKLVLVIIFCKFFPGIYILTLF